MTGSLLRTEFEASVEPYRRELIVYCYRMLGSFSDAEDLVQETLLRAWRARDRYDEQRASWRTWLYRIATNVCLTALSGRARRPLPSGLGPAAGDPDHPLVPDFEVPWLQPLPDRARSADPAEHAAERAGIRLAFVAALQRLSARQRAVLILREVLEFSAAEVADQLDSTTAAVNSALQRARVALASAEPGPDLAEPDDPAVRRTVDRYVRAFEAADVTALVGLLTADVVLEMPPVPLWYAGAAAYGAFMTRVFRTRGTDWRTRLDTANGQPALVAYRAGEDGVFRLHTLQVLSVIDGAVARNVVFQDPTVFAAFDLAPVFPH
ncbi:sigma-70 family RNA polymerase sigma factor [Microlunatus parietis]|uniref:RNA polymerase sigma factor n=1 Tax=Microlunatus parietis TaxID=682979 RepID=A0A7Y9LBF6_9ACTN|nr:sigma-70 family RNA polymerase sigma factor [Microlunatus parietis]NYE70798.1 RNA polymerase sigma-70 factor (ECF subfamily) [Microlunatus parietis]